MPEEYHKLVRDRIPEIVERNGETPVTRVADGEEYGDLLLAKLDEEVGEFVESTDAEELADVLEVLDAIREFEGISERAVQDERAKKGEQRGRFEDRIVLEEVRS